LRRRRVPANVAEFDDARPTFRERQLRAGALLLAVVVEKRNDQTRFRAHSAAEFDGK
jgi:hypothetical protein